MDPATKFHIKQNIIKKHMSPNVSYKAIGKMCIMEKVYAKTFGHKVIYESLFSFMKEHNIEPKEPFPDGFVMPWTISPDVDKERVEAFKTIDEIDEDIHREEKTLLDHLSLEKEEVISEMNRLQKVSDAIDILENFYKNKK